MLKSVRGYAVQSLLCTLLCNDLITGSVKADLLLPVSAAVFILLLLLCMQCWYTENPDTGPYQGLINSWFSCFSVFMFQFWFACVGQHNVLDDQLIDRLVDRMIHNKFNTNIHQ